MKKVKLTRSSGNVFHDLGFPPEEAEHLRVRSDLMLNLQKAIAARGLKQGEAAELLGVTQPRVSDLMRGRIDLFSIDTLIDMLARFGIRAKVVLQPETRWRARVNVDKEVFRIGRRPTSSYVVFSPGKDGMSKAESKGLSVRECAMKLQRVYVDTSVIGGCFDPEFAPWSNGLIKDFHLGYVLPVVSELVAAEIQPAPERIRRKYGELLDLGAEVLIETDDALALARAYLAHGIVPRTFQIDALHIAIATVAAVDLLVSWNFAHIVRFDKIRMFNAVNRELGYRALEIYSPREVTQHEEG